MPAGAESHLRIEGLHKRFGSFAALSSVDLEVCEGEFVCLLGPSGCGKTTLLRIIAGLEKQSEGRLWQRGKDISSLPPAGRDFGIVFQSYALFPNLRVAENIAYGLENRSKSRAEVKKRVGELLARVGLSEQGEKFPAQLSGGQQQRVAIARALCMKPKAILFDEPTSALDPEMVSEVLETMTDLAKTGMTMICVTHEMGFARAVADEIVFMDEGEIVERNNPAGFFDNPRQERTRRFLNQILR